MNRVISYALIATALGTLCGCASTPESGSTNGDAPVTLQVPADVRDMANNPTPPANASRSSTVGTGATAVSTADSPGDLDYVWTAQIDVTGDGQVEVTQVLWDDEDKVLILSAATTFACDDGGEGAGQVLVGVFGTGNTYREPAGSGSFAVELDASECAAAAAGLFGCDFDADGDPTTCGEAVVDANTGDIEIAVASRY